MIKIKTEQIEQLIQIIHEQNAWYIGAIGFVVAVMTIFLTFYSFQQKRISDRQIEKFTAEIKRAERISADLKESNEAILQYSLSVMNRESYMAHTAWKQQANLFFKSQDIYHKYYSQNKELKQKLTDAKAAVVMASQQSFEGLLKKDDKTYDEIHSPEFQSAYVLEWVFQEDMNFQVLVDFDYQKMKEIGHGLKSPDVQSQWFNQLEQVNNFWSNAKVE
ncbi:hypothetical protein [Lactiplantibacillus plantarum]|uniref:hypothetical protein n=1 Tax=Lactiplantibacillus plantarum TaxID=1590 RepID=UPI0030F13CAC